MTFWQLTEKKVSFGHERLGRVVNTSFSRVHRNIWWKQKFEEILSFFISVEDSATFFWPLDETIPAG